MTPAARLRAAAEILDAALGSLRRAERGAPTMEARLAAWGRSNRYAGSKDRAAIGDLIFDALRRKRRLAAAMGDGADARALLLSAQAAEGASLEEIEALACGGDRALSPLSAAERAALGAIAAQGLDGALPATLSTAARADLPDWLWTALAASSETAAEEARYLARRAAVDLRVNRLKASAPAATEALSAAGVATAPAPLSPIGLRCQGAPRLGALAVSRDGWIEPQDASSQAAALLCGASPGQTVLDFCAGGGGKTLALAAQMGGAGALVAFDVDARRMAGLPDRARRAGAAVRIAARVADLDGLRGRCDLVLVDAPCSGSGAWARQPEAKWRLSPDRLAALGRAQASAVDHAATFVRLGGRLVYVTCSLLRVENEDQADAFVARQAAFAPGDPIAAWAAAGLRGAPPSGADAAGALRLSPALERPGGRSDGFFVAIFERRR